jgi:hypothetical protein
LISSSRRFSLSTCAVLLTICLFGVLVAAATILVTPVLAKAAPLAASRADDAASLMSAVRSASDMTPLIAVQQAELIASDHVSCDYFGTSVAISGNTALVGAPWKTVKGYLQAGAVYVFTRSGASWSQQTELCAADAFLYEKFGDSVALDGDTAIIGAPEEGTDTGAAYVFTGSGANWSQQAKLTSSDAAYFDNFGTSVAISGDTALVGDYPSGQPKPGAAYVFARSGANWSQRAELAAADATAGDAFGASLALQDGTALIGARDQVVAGTRCGAGYVFTGSGANWTQQAELTGSDAATASSFGCSVALSGDTALVGADTQAVDGKSHAGAAYVFTGSGANWSQQAELSDPADAANDMFGYVVALDGGMALIDRYPYTGSGANWSPQSELAASDSITADQFGSAIALSGGTALIGAPNKVLGSGAAYVDVLGDTVPVSTAAPVASGSPVAASVLVCSPGSWTDYPALAFTYQWFRSLWPIGGATSATYKVQPVDCGLRLTCQVTATSSAGQAAATSNAILVAKPKLALKASASLVKLGHSVTLSGVVTGCASGNRVVRICRKVNGTFRLLKSVTIGPSGSYHWTMKANKPGKSWFEARYRLDASFFFMSKAVSVTVRR